jgi:hypothetical protein
MNRQKYQVSKFMDDWHVSFSVVFVINAVDKAFFINVKL